MKELFYITAAHMHKYTTHEYTFKYFAFVCVVYHMPISVIFLLWCTKEGVIETIVRLTNILIIFHVIKCLK